MNRIKSLREELNMTQQELADKIGGAKSTIAMYEKGDRKPSLEVLIKLSKLFDCSMDYLMGRSDYKTNKESFTHYKKRVFSDAFIKVSPYLLDLGFSTEQVLELEEMLVSIKDSNSFNKLDKFKNLCSPNDRDRFDAIIRIFYRNVEKQLEFDELKTFRNAMAHCHMLPVYGQISAGQPNWAEECIEGKLPIDPNLMGIVNPDEHYFLRVNGESMNKVVKNGAFALIHKQDTVENGEIAVVLVNGYDATLKKFTKQGDLVILEPQSDDESFETQVYDKNTPIKILGKYVGKMEFNK